MNLRLWTPRYIVNRGISLADRLFRPFDPWLTRQAICYLSAHLRSTDSGFEWGSGRSTVWFARRIARLVSIENNPLWHARVCGRLQRHNLKNVDYRLIEDSSRYKVAADSFPDNSFDFCLVDGSDRDACALAAIRIVRPGGLLVLDNSNWFLPGTGHAPNSRRAADGPETPLWAEFINRTMGWRSVWTTNGVWDTTIFIKPAS
jgi:SAM-dependent methyltransferase